MTTRQSRLTPRHVRHELLVNRLAASMFLGLRARTRLLRLAGLDVRTNRVRHGCFFGSADVRIGEGTFINVGCFFDGVARIEIGDRCGLGIQTMILTGGHTVGGPEQRVASWCLVRFGSATVPGSAPEHW